MQRKEEYGALGLIFLLQLVDSRAM